jgi:hypothetical protein
MTRTPPRAIVSLILAAWLSPPAPAQTAMLSSSLLDSGKAGPDGPPASLLMTDEEMLSVVQQARDRLVFESLREVSIETRGNRTPGGGYDRQLSDEMQFEFNRRVTKMGLKVVEDDLSKAPRLTLRLQLIDVPVAPRFLAYALELSLEERVNLTRKSLGAPVARTSVFRSFGHVRKTRMKVELGEASGKLLDQLQRAIEVSHREPLTDAH